MSEAGLTQNSFFPILLPPLNPKKGLQIMVEKNTIQIQSVLLTLKSRSCSQMKNSKLRLGFFSVQWFVFLLTNSIMLPIVVGQIFQMAPEEIFGLVQRTLFVVGVSSFLAGWLGHRLPIVEGPAGIWLGIFILMGQMAAAKGTDPILTLRLLEGGMLITGLTLVLIGSFRWMNKMLRLFTPLVTGVYLILLALQLSGTLLRGMLGVSDTSTTIEPSNVIISLSVFLLVFACSVWGKMWLKNYAVLIGVIVGWIAYSLVNGSESIPEIGSVMALPEVLAWGSPRLDVGIVVTGFVVAFVLLSNLIASATAMEQVLNEKEQAQGKFSRLDRGGIMTGVTNMLCSLFPTVGVVPMSATAGFARLTGQNGQNSKTPFFIACLTLVFVSFIPGIYSFLSLLPGQVAFAVMLATFGQMIGIGLVSITKVPLDERRLTIVGLSLSFGTGVMFLPQKMFSALPTLFQYLLSNGIMVGMLVALLLEQVWKIKTYASDSSVNKASNSSMN
jgi:xanthine/uracil permease